MFVRPGFVRSLAIVVAMALTLCVQSAQAQTTASGPYYATPSWDQSFPASTRFVVLTNFNNAAVLDRETGLVWERSPSTSAFRIVLPPGQFGGSTAWERCVGLSIANHMGWRVPTIQELTSLMDRSQSPALPAGHPFTVLTTDIFGFSLLYLSSTEYRNNFGPAYRIVSFVPGQTGATSADVHVWCVRGGSGTPIQ
jgi:hypothetical protein